MNNQITKSNCIYNLFFGITTFCTIISSTNLVSAQIVPDNTLPNNSQVGIEGNTTKIEGGTTAGGNLFHSFEKFGVTTGGEAHFNNAVDINNIITRVTGKSISNIDGLIKANGTANLFLINPNGIVFGENVKLDIGGSFVGSTADAIGFGENNFFSASNPDSSSLLRVNPSALFFNQVRAASIESNSVAQEELNSSGDNAKGFKGLRVPNGKSLLLVGGDIDIDIDGGRLWAFGGHIELGGLASKGTIGLNLDEDGNNIRLSFPEGVEKSNVSLNKGMSVNVRDGDGGSIAVNARNLKMTDNSSLLAGIKSERGTDDSRAGDIDVNVTDEINLNDGSLIDNRLLPKAKGQGGDININAGTLLLKNGAQVRTNNRSKGKGGNLTVNANDVQLIGTNEKGHLSGLFSEAKADSTGDAGDVTINTSSLRLEDGGQVNTSTSSQGKGGNLTVNAEDIRLIGTNEYGRLSGFAARSSEKATGDAGDLTIKTNTLEVRDGARVSTEIFGKGNGGNLTVNASDVQLIGTSKKGRLSGLFSEARPDSTGDTGNVTINTSSLRLEDGGQVNTSTSGKGKGGNLTVNAEDIRLIGTNEYGRLSGFAARSSEKATGDAGDLTIKTNTLEVRDGARVDTTTFGQGNGGNLTVYAQDVKLIGEGINSKGKPALSGLFAGTFDESTGNAGDLTIETNTLLVKDGGQVSTSTVNNEQGGNITVNAQDVQLIGKTKKGSTTGLSARANPKSTGDAGNVTINTDSLRLKDGGQVSVSTVGKGNAGNLIIDALDVELTGESSLFAQALEKSSGDAGNLTINTNSLQVKDGAEVAVKDLTTEGTAGKLTINADSIRLNNKGLISARTRSNEVDPEREQATININSQDIIMRDRSQIETNAEGANVIGGDIIIDTNFLIANENSDISANSANSKGGNVRIDALGIFGTQFRPQLTPQSDITATGANPELDGTVEIITPQTDPTSGSIKFPTIPVETEVADACSTPGYAQSSFTITGKGSLIPSPFEPLPGRLNRTKLATLESEGEVKLQRRQRTRVRKEEPQKKKIVEARGWVRTPDGQIILVADAPQNTNSQAITKSANCKFTESASNEQ